ncbi:DUF6701 domain-containing protein [Vibrio sp. 10N.222.54.B12]|uniref:DUF6701 domain-containing protein n=1 Tax=unclassified Vibrio TaxID=2614977 RepID=UPI003553EDA2
MVMSESNNLGLNLRIGLLLLLFFMTTPAYSTPYDLNNSNDFGQLCTGNHSTSNNPRVYLCEGQFKADNAVVSLDGGSVINAYSGYDIKSTTIEPTSGYVELQSNNWGGDTTLDSVVLKGSIYVPYAISIKNSTVDKYVKNTTNHNISIYSSVIGEYVDAGTTITIDGSDVIGDVYNRGNNGISILNDSEVGGYVDGGTTIKVDASEVVGNVSNRSTNDISVLNDSEIGGYVDGGSTITIDNSEVSGNVTNRSNNEIFVLNDAEVGGDVSAQGKLNISDSEIDGNISSANHNIELDNGAVIYGNATAANNNWSTIYFRDYEDSDRSVVHGTCLYRTDPEDACGSIDPPINQNPQFEFGTLTDNNCTISSPGPDNKQVVTCTLNFNNTYDIAKPKPLVFVMPTIDASLSVRSNGTTELPSTASVINTTWQSATIVQEIAPSAKKKTNNITYLDAPMSGQGDPLKSSNYIDYFVIEEGVISLNNGESQIVAGLVNTNTAASQVSSERNNADLIRYEDYGLDSFNFKPGVLVQPQEKNNTSAWFTGMARNVGVESFSLALEKSEVINNNSISENENVAFVAGEGSGFIQGARFFLGNAETRVTTTLSEKVISPIEIGCEEFTSIADAGFDAPPILVANKNSRSGNNGGWVRRCDITKDKVYFIVEEDMDKDSERSHIAEDVGFFMFDRPNEIGICEGFNDKSPAQTWKGSNGSLEINGSPKIVGALRDNGNRYVGFLDSNTHDRTGVACEGQQCYGLDDLLIDKEALEDVPDNLGNSLDIPYTHNITTLPITVGGVKIYEYDSISIGTGAVVEIESGKYKIGTLNINGTGELRVKSGDTVTIFTKKLSVNNGSYAGIPIVSWSGDKPVLASDTHFRVNVLENGTNQVSLNSSGSGNKTTFTGLLYSEQKVDMSGTARLYGAVSAQAINMSSDALIHAETSCIVPSDDYDIEISPATDLALMCGDDSPQFTINTSNNGVGESLGVTVGITPDADEFDVSLLKGSGTYPNYISNNDGELTIQVTAQSTSSIDFDTSYKLTAILVDDSGKGVESQFKFVPFKFSLVDGNSPTNRLDVIAGQATPTVTKVLACDLGGSIVVAENYAGEAGDEVTITHELDSSWSGSDGSLTYLPEFKKGIASTDLTISESGLFNVTLKDSSFDCTGFAGCPEDGSYDVEGSFSIYSRPWKFAICTGSNSDGNSSGGNAFVAAGEEFDVFAKPIRFSSNANPSCNNSLVTQNYLLSSGAVVATHTLDTPSNNGAVLGSLEPGSQLTQSSSDISLDDNGYKFKSLNYSEVGSINFEVTEDSSSFYGKILGGFSGNKNIGRFYPDYLTLISNSWNYSSGHDSFAYMAQGISFNFIVEARNRDNEPVTNYGLFADSLKASIKHVAINEEDGAVLNTRVWLSGEKDADHISWGEDDWSSDRLTIENFDYEFLRLASEDGPYDGTTSEFGVWVSDKVDGVDLQFLDLDNTNTDYTNGTKFNAQPDFRYGRMSLKDVGGNQGSSIQVPLEVQYWSGSKFEINSDDSGSQFNGSDYCVTKIWHDSEVTDAKLTSDTDDNGSDDIVSVLKGVSSNLIAKQDTSRREQVRLFLRQGSSPSGATCFGSKGTQPWLQYNWRGLGDEDPSTVVTFGIYRGNDRVIYRGESGLTGQQ